MSQYQARMCTYIHKASLSSWALFILLTKVAINKLLRWLSGRESTFQRRRHRRPRFDLWVRKIPWRWKWQLQYSCLENSTDRGAWWATVHRVAKSRTQLSTSTRNQYCNAFIISRSEYRKVHTCTKLHKT